VAVVAPASPFPRDEFEEGIAEIRRLGFEPVFDQAVFDRRRYVAGDEATRASAIRAALADVQVAAVLTARGGYGSVQLLPSMQLAGQSPSQVSPVSTAWFPQVTEQSISVLWSQPGGQQPSAAPHVVTAECVQV
jgi:hypothetical protein